MARLVVVLSLAAAAGACRSRTPDDAPCAVVAGRLFTLAQAELARASVEPAVRRAVADQLPAMRDAMAHACSEGDWSAEVRRCMANAPDHLTLQACQEQLTDAQRHEIERAAQGKTTSH